MNREFEDDKEVVKEVVQKQIDKSNIRKAKIDRSIRLKGAVDCRETTVSFDAKERSITLNRPLLYITCTYRFQKSYLSSEKRPAIRMAMAHLPTHRTDYP